MDELHERRARSFGAVAATYDRVRPGYPADAVRWLLAPVSGGVDTDGRSSGVDLGGTEGRRLRVADMGAGTGALTRGLVALGVDVVAVEPDPQMRAVFAASTPGVDVRAGSAERLPLDDGTVDAVLGAQMWHWVDPEHAAAEAARVLRPGGVLGLLWNTRDHRVPWMATYGAILGGEDYHSGPARVVLPEDAPFTDGESADFAWSQRLAPEDLVALAETRSQVQVLPSDERAALLARVADLVATDPALAGRTDIAVPYITACWRARRR